MYILEVFVQSIATHVPEFDYTLVHKFSIQHKTMNGTHLLGANCKLHEFLTNLQQ